REPHGGGDEHRECGLARPVDRRSEWRVHRAFRFGSRLERRLRVEDIHPSTPGPRIPRRDGERAGHHAGGAAEPATGRGRRRCDCARRGRPLPDAAEAMTTGRSISMAVAILAAGLVLILAPATPQRPTSGRTAAVNVTVRFYVDSILAGTEKIARLNPGAQITETFNYLPAGVQPGTHQVRVEADLDGHGVIDPAKGEAVVSSLFYRGTAPL